MSILNPERIDFSYVEAVTEAAQKQAPLWPVKALFHQAAHALVRHGAVVHYISDNGLYDDTARGEIKIRLDDARALLRAISGKSGPRIEYHDIPPQDTFAAAFDLGQFARGAVRGFGNVYFVNCAPRKKQRGKEGGNAGESIYIGMLPSGAIVAGTGEEVFVHFKDLVKAGVLNIYRANVAISGTQFRSRDYFPWAAIAIGNYIDQIGVNRRWRNDLTGEQRDALLSGLGIVTSERLGAEMIPDLPNAGYIAARADTHGNLKLGKRHSEVVAELASSDNPEVTVEANGEKIAAVLATHSFDKEEGITAISAGSSGIWRGFDGEWLTPFAEVFTVGGRARDELGIDDRHLRRGVEVRIQPTVPVVSASPAPGHRPRPPKRTM